MCVYVLGSTKPNLVDPKKNQYFVKGHNTVKKEKKIVCGSDERETLLHEALKPFRIYCFEFVVRSIYQSCHFSLHDFGKQVFVM